MISPYKPAAEFIKLAKQIKFDDILESIAVGPGGTTFTFANTAQSLPINLSIS